MTRTMVPPATRRSASLGAPTRRRAAVLALAALSIAACGGDDDSSSTTTPTTSGAPVSFTTPPTLVPVPTAAEVPTTPPAAVYVTDGASVMVANASRVDGGAGRLTERLAEVGFTTVAASNYVPSRLDVTKIYYDPASAPALAVATSLKEAFGGGAIELLELTVPPPVDTGDMAGATVLVAMGNDIADKTLDQLQGRAPTTTEPADEESSTGESSTDEATAESSTAESSSG